ncbi:LacI family transcriptional regulator [bacterium D16-76]|nr:LacI family transcriptional regulator [bacterium D16-76]
MVKLTDIAERAQVSVGTVSHVLGGKGDQRRISKATQERVLQIAAELNYQPNVFAKRLRDRHSVPVFTLFYKPGLSATFLGEIVRGIQKVQMETAHSFEVMVQPYVSEEFQWAKNALGSTSVNGVIMCNTTIEESRELESMSLRAPMVFFNRYSSKYSSVYSDFSLVGGQIARLFYEKGYKNVALVGTGQNISNHVKREKGFMATCAQLGLSAKLWTGEAIGDSAAYGYRLTREILRSGPAPDGIFYSADEFAMGGIRACAEKGIKLPQAMGIIGYGSSHFNGYLTPSVSSVGFPISNMIQDCVNLLLDKYYNNSPECKSIRFQADFSFRESFQPGREGGK